MSSGFRNSSVVFAWISMVVASGCVTTTEQDLMGNTNWLVQCEASAACGDGLSCECGVCSAECTRNADCKARGGGECVAVGSLPGCDGRAEIARACLPPQVALTQAQDKGVNCTIDSHGDTHCFWADAVLEGEPGSEGIPSSGHYCRQLAVDGGMSWECWPIEVGPAQYETCTEGYPELPCTRRDEPRREPVCVGGEDFANCYEEGAVPFGANGPLEEGDLGSIEQVCRVAADGTPDTCWPVVVPRGTYPTCQGNFDQLPCEQAWRDW